MIAILQACVFTLCISICSGQESPLKQFLDKPVSKGLWPLLRSSDLCIEAALVSVDHDNKEYLMDSKKNVIAEYTPVKMSIVRILYASNKIEFDGRFLKILHNLKEP